MRILITSRSEKALQTLEARIASAGSYEIEGVVMVNGARDPLRVVDYRPDVLVMHAGEHMLEELQSLAERPVQSRPALIVVGDELPAEATRYAMRAGARDFIREQDDFELAESLRRLEAEIGFDSGSRGKSIVVINAKGGSGGTFVATSLAHLSVTAGGEETAVVDLDFQYAPLPNYLDVKPRRGLLEALANSAELDETAISAYAVEHESGLEVFAPVPDAQSPVDFNLADAMMQFLAVLKRRYDKVVLDVPRHLDELSSRVLQDADEIVLVMQQSLLAVQDAVRLKTILVEELEIPERKITVVVNRHSRNSTLEVDDIGKALDDEDLLLIPNQYKLVTQALELGVPVTEQAQNSGVARSLMALQGRVMHQHAPGSKGFLAKTVMRFRG